MIGMLGGMGPESTSYCYLRMIRYCQARYCAKLDNDFPPIIMFSMPVTDVVGEGSDDRAVISALGRGLAILRSAGASFSFIACNTMQGFVPELRREYDLLSIVEETTKAAKASGVRNWGLLSTETTARKGFYQKAFASSGMGLMTTEGVAQAEVTKAIREILCGTDASKPAQRLKSVINCLQFEGAEGVVLACTDLPIALSSEIGMPVLDTADIVARSAINRYMGEYGGPPFLF